jgi:hypothetical protein
MKSMLSHCKEVDVREVTEQCSFVESLYQQDIISNHLNHGF